MSASCSRCVAFGSSSKLAAAYGIAVTIDMLITTTMTFFVIRYGWKYPLVAVGRGDRLLLHRRLHLSSAANVVKIFDGGWFPVAIGIGRVHC